MNKILGLLKKHWMGILGLIIVLFYLTSALRLINYPQHLFIIMALAISPVAIFGVMAIGKRLSKTADHFSLQLGNVFGIIAFAIWEAVMCIQFGTRIYYREHLSNKASDEVSLATIKVIYNAINSVQFTMDISFDIFYCLLIILFSYWMYRNKDFGKAVGVFGIFSGLGLLVFNLWAFPYPPAESGLVDFGPLTGVWWVWVIVKMYRAEQKDDKLSEG